MDIEHTTNILVTNIDPKVTVESLTTFFSFTGNVTSVRLSDAPNGTKTAIVTFDNEESVKTAELMSGATLENNRIEIQPTTLVQQTENDDVYFGDSLPQRTIPELPEQHTKTSVAASLLARGYILASDTFQKAVEFDKQHSISATIKAGAQKVKETAIAVDEKLHFTEYLALGAAYVNSVITAVDEKYEVSKTVSNAVNTVNQKIDETFHVSQGVEIAKQTLQNGVDYVKNSQPVVAIRNTTNNFKEDVKNEITIRRPDLENDNEKKEEEMKNDFNVEITLENENEEMKNYQYGQVPSESNQMEQQTYQLNQNNQTVTIPPIEDTPIVVVNENDTVPQ